ncbi:MAG: methyltransferase domain-containing protein [Rickettsiaceae bacterium]|nr:methyltransferase domain-containing protein [Rickettsiaceae bacterium]
MQIIKDIFSTANKLFKSSVAFIVNLPSSILKGKAWFKSYIKQFHYNLNNLSESNLKLGIYHLENRNFNDAIFRFKFVDKYLDKGNKEANYYLGCVYFMKNNYPQAVKYLEKGASEDKINLKQFIKQIDNVQQVPDDIYVFHRDINAEIFIDKFASDTKNLPQIIVQELLNTIEDLPDQYSILDLGSNISILGNELRRKMPDSFDLIRVECSSEMIVLGEACFPDVTIYDNTHQTLPIKYVAETKEQYDVIVSLEGISYQADLAPIFDNLYKVLKDNGYIALCFKYSQSRSFSAKHLEFSYNEEQIVELLTESGFTIQSKQKIMLEIKNNYYIFIARKSI